MSTTKSNYIKARRSNYIVIDIETTGLDFKNDEIIEICALKIKNRKEVDKFCTFINPNIEISEFITSITNITNEMVANAPKIEDILLDLYDFIGKDAILLGHNIIFDIKFINHNLEKHYGKKLDNKYMDTLHLSKNFIKEVDDHSLETIKNYLEISGISHRAYDDCVTTHLIYEWIKSYTTEHNLTITGYVKDTSIKYNKVYKVNSGATNFNNKEKAQINNIIKMNAEEKKKNKNLDRNINNNEWYNDATTKQKIILFIFCIIILIIGVLFAKSL